MNIRASNANSISPDSAPQTRLSSVGNAESRRWRALVAWTSNYSAELTAYALLATLILAALGPALSFAPADSDDMILLSSVAQARTPWQFFVGDSGIHNFVYRPLHSVLLWLTYRAVGTNNFVHQFINLALHIATTMLLYRLLFSLVRNRAAAFLLAAFWAVSHQTISGAIWVSDRPAAFVALCGVLAAQEVLETKPRVSKLLCYSALALLSKESGMVVPMVVAAFLFWKSPRSKQAWMQIGYLSLLCVSYMIFRKILFGDTTLYSERGYLWGIQYYDAEQARSMRASVWPDNTMKNLIQPLMPIFDNFGRLSPSFSISHLPIWMPTFALFVLALIRARQDKALNEAQRLGLLFIAMNAVVHFGVFRYRTLFLGCLGYVLLLAPLVAEYQSDQASEPKRFPQGVVMLSLNAVLLFSVFFTGRSVALLGMSLNEEVRIHRLENNTQNFADKIRPEIQQAILQQYGATTSP